MMRILVGLLCGLVLLVQPAFAATIAVHRITGEVRAHRLAGIEPDGDPLNQVVLVNTLHASGLPAMHLIINSYMENFKPDTTPLLPDLLNPNKQAMNLGGFLQGKALLTDDRGDVLYVGSFLAEAFLDNSNHTVMRLQGTGAARGGRAVLRGTFRLRAGQSTVTLSGQVTGPIVLPSAARTQIDRHRGETMRSLQQILQLVTVRPAPMLGRATTGSTGAPLHTGFGASLAQAQGTRRRITPLTIVAASGAVICLILGGYLYWSEKRGSREQSEAKSA